MNVGRGFSSSPRLISSSSSIVFGDFSISLTASWINSSSVSSSGKISYSSFIETMRQNSRTGSSLSLSSVSYPRPRVFLIFPSTPMTFLGDMFHNSSKHFMRPSEIDSVIRGRFTIRFMFGERYRFQSILTLAFRVEPFSDPSFIHAPILTAWFGRAGEPL